MVNADQTFVGKAGKSDFDLPVDATNAQINTAFSHQAALAYLGTRELAQKYFNAKLNQATVDFTSQEPGPLNPGVLKNNKDCGPTSLTTALKTFGILSPYSNPGQDINALRMRVTGADDRYAGTSLKELTNGAESYGISTRQITGIRQLNRAMSHGKTAIIGGAPTNVYDGVNFKGTNVDSAPTDRHFVAVLARDPKTHKYLVDNPADTSGPTEKSRKQMKAFISDTGLHGGIALGLGPELRLAHHARDGAMRPMSAANSAGRFDAAAHRTAVPNHNRGAGVGVDIMVPIAEFRF